jgi:RsmE family RNA methyltransferase
MVVEEKHIFSFYYSPINKEIFFIDNKDDLYKRIVLVLRMQLNDIYICFDKNTIYTVVIIEINKKSIINKIIEKKPNQAVGKRVVAYIPYLEREYANEVFYMMGQQGISDVILVKTDLTQIRGYTEKDYLRFEKLMIQGCEQGKQYTIPRFNKNALSIPELVNKQEKLYWFYEQGELLPMVLQNNYIEEKEYSFLCGPERGYSQEEITILQKITKYQSIRLSSSILRSVDAIQFASILFRSI